VRSVLRPLSLAELLGWLVGRLLLLLLLLLVVVVVVLVVVVGLLHPLAEWLGR
jgi:hypothetical protein